MPLVTRAQIAEKFGIQKKGPTHVVNNNVQNDGYDIKDIEGAITLYAMQKFLGTEEEGLSELWEMMVAKVEGRHFEPIQEVNTPPITDKEFTPGNIIEIKRKPGRPKKNA